MTTVPAKLHAAAILTTCTRKLLQEALHQANHEGYDPHWIDLITQAVNDGRKLSAYAHHVATMLERAAPPAKSPGD